MRRSPRGLLILALAAVTLAAACASPFAPDAPELVLPPVEPAPAQPALLPVTATPSPEPAPPDRQEVKRLLQESARRHGVNPNLVMGVAWWESGWDQSRVSSTGAVGIMQVEPATAESAGPLLLHRMPDIHDPVDNVEVGTAVLRENLDIFHNDVAKALAAYYAGPEAAANWKEQGQDVKRYVLGVYRLALAFSNGTGPA